MRSAPAAPASKVRICLRAPVRATGDPARLASYHDRRVATGETDGRSPWRTRALEILALTLVFYAITTLPSPLEHGFYHPRFLGQVIGVAAPALLFSGSAILALMGAPALALEIVNGSRALMVTMVFVTIAALVLWPDRRRRMLPVDRQPWTLAVLAGGLHSMFSGTIIMPASQALLVLALALALPGPRDTEPGRTATTATGWALAAVGAMALVILLATFTLPPVDEVRGVWGPRFFSRGIIP
jgi:hypothetical protein